MSDKSSFIFYRSFYESISSFDPEIRIKFYDAIFEYALNGVDPEFDQPFDKAIFALIKPILNVNEKRRGDGSKGGRPPKKTSVSQKKEPESEENKPVVIEEKTSGFETENQWFPHAEPNVDVDVDVDKDVDEDVDEEKKKDKPNGLSKKGGPYAFEGQTIKLNLADFDAYRENCPKLSDEQYRLALSNCDQAFKHGGSNNWFFRLANGLRIEQDKMAKAGQIQSQGVHYL